MCVLRVCERARTGADTDTYIVYRDLVRHLATSARTLAFWILRAFAPVESRLYKWVARIIEAARAVGASQRLNCQFDFQLRAHTARRCALAAAPRSLSRPAISAQIASATSPRESYARRHRRQLQTAQGGGDAVYLRAAHALLT